MEDVYWKFLFNKKTQHSVNVNSTSSLVANRSNNAANPNSSVSYLNVNNTPSNSNANISSQLLTVDSISFSIRYCY